MNPGPPFPAGTAVLFTDQNDDARGVQAGTIAEALEVPSGWLYVVALERGGQVRPVFPEELEIAADDEAPVGSPGWNKAMDEVTPK
jgi:hypothetical protein